MRREDNTRFIETPLKSRVICGQTHLTTSVLGKKRGWDTVGGSLLAKGTGEVQANLLSCHILGCERVKQPR